MAVLKSTGLVLSAAWRGTEWKQIETINNIKKLRETKHKGPQRFGLSIIILLSFWLDATIPILLPNLGEMNKVNPLFFVTECCIFQGLKVDDLLLPYCFTVIILELRNLEVKKMAQRRAEKPKKVRISSKQQEFYDRLRSSR
jgi:hypothetical protein